MTKLVAIGLFALVTIPASAQQLDDAAVLAAIKAGQDKKAKDMVSSCIATSGFSEGLFASGTTPTGSFDVIVSLAPGRIAYAAADAKRLYKPFGLKDVPAELRDTGTVFVTVEPQKPSSSGGKYSTPSPIDRIVLKSKVNPSAVAQPQDFVTEPREWSNLLGGKVEANAAFARYALADLREMPDGDIDIVVVTAAGERRCKIGAKDRTKILGVRTGAGTK
jgi:hypothetical protein